MSRFHQSMRVHELIENPVNQVQIIDLHMEINKLKLEIEKLKLELIGLKNMVTEIYQVPGGPNYFRIYTDYLQNLNALSPNNSATPTPSMKTEQESEDETAEN